jgi:hypothetical protein
MPTAPSTSAPFAGTPATPAAPEPAREAPIGVLQKRTCPLDTSAFTHFLSKHGIASRYPHLVSSLNHGFRIGDMPPILHTIIHQNHPSIKAHGSFARDYVLEETAHGRMSGLFTRSEMESICGGAFHCSPYLVVVRPGNAGEPDKLRLCINLSKSGSDEAGRDVLSVNEHIDPDNFVTRFDSAMIMADKAITSSCVRTRR